MTDPAHILLARKTECESDGLYFARYFFKQRFGAKMLIGRHHRVIQDALDRTMLPPSHPDFISRLIINVPPGYTKSELASISYPARGLALNPMARFLNLSSGEDLALLFSDTAREIVKSAEYQSMWAVEAKKSVDSKSMWHTTRNGGITARAAGGQVTGFRAGHMDATQFTGALTLDDPVKPDDAYSEAKRSKINNRYNETIASRVQLETVPIIVIMQRIHYDDLSGYLLRGGSGEKWHHLCLPVIIDNSEAYPTEYTHGIPIDHGLADGWLWPEKHNETHAEALRAHRRRWLSQYMQRPPKQLSDNALWDERKISRARELEFSGDVVRRVVAVDPATTDSPTSDEHGVGVASMRGPLQFAVEADYTLERGSPEDWAARAIQAYDETEADAIVIETNQGGDMCESTLRNSGFKGRIIRVHASRGKIPRAEPVSALYGLGQVAHSYIGCGEGLLKLEDEMLDLDPLTGKANGRSPNRVDWLVWALTELSGGHNNLSQLLDMAMGR